MKRLAFATLAALALLSGAAQAATKDVFGDINATAPRGTFEQINETAPKGTFDQLNETAPRSGDVFQDIKDTAPRSDGVYGGLENNAPQSSTKVAAFEPGRHTPPGFAVFDVGRFD